MRKREVFNFVLKIIPMDLTGRHEKLINVMKRTETAESREEWQEIVNYLNQKCLEYGISINVKKSKIIAIDKKDQVKSLR